MNIETVKRYLNIAPENCMITIFNRSDKTLKFVKKNINYSFDNETLVITDKTKKALIILNIKYIVEIKIDYEKFKPMSWVNSENKIKV